MQITGGFRGFTETINEASPRNEESKDEDTFRLGNSDLITLPHQIHPFDQPGGQDEKVEAFEMQLSTDGNKNSRVGQIIMQHLPLNDTLLEDDTNINGDRLNYESAEDNLAIDVKEL